MRTTPSSRRISRYRKARGLSQAGLARELDVPVVMIYNWETGGVIPNLSNRLRLEAFFGDSIYNEDPPVVSRKVASILTLAVKNKAKKLPFARFIAEVSRYVDFEMDYMDIVEAYVTEKWEIKENRMRSHGEI